MSFVEVSTDLVAAAASDVEGIGSSLRAANAAAAARTAAVITAAEDEVSTAIASLFSSHGQQFQALSAQAAAFHSQFVKLLGNAQNTYAAVEAANTTPLQSIGREVSALFGGTGNSAVPAGGAGLPTDAVPLTVVGGSYPTVNVSVAGGSSVPVLVDTGSKGLVIPLADVKWWQLGLPTGFGTAAFGGSGGSTLGYSYLTFHTTVNFGDGIVTGKTTIEVPITAATTSASGVVTRTSFASAIASLGFDGVLGIGPNATGPGTSSPIQALPGDLNQGVLFNEPAGYLQFGPNPLPAVTSVTGAPTPSGPFTAPGDVGLVVTSPSTTNYVWSWGDTPTPYNGIPLFYDSGGANGTFPSYMDPNNTVGYTPPAGTTVPVGTTISYYENPVNASQAPGPGNGTLVYSYTINATDAPTEVATSDFNSGNVPFAQGPVYISNTPSGVGTIVFDYPTIFSGTLP